MQLYIGNKNYSSWSMRPWVLMRQFGIPFDEVMLRFDGFEPDSRFKQAISKLSPTGRVPLLVDDSLVVWDTLAIAEYLGEKYADRKLWPHHAADRARARSLCAEMHAGFGALRSHCPMNIEATLPAVGAKVMAEQPGVRIDLARIIAMWMDALAASGGPYLFGDYSIADAYFAPVVMRLRSYALPVPEAVSAYMAQVVASPGVNAWIRDALAEQDFLAFEEPYRTTRT
ncbi:glutathione S-transferase family protein [Aquabacterium sp.]|uniref:glutathione S-transferase family protein n=1 Tax=Aquabacterium sp. TaxID=1872578 RepID=UPI002CCC591F|nr:glutathione S-transferase family protein [Aquabacterium sp.]HSW08207.1 glutathione S-transferase family protein [Aquabacterium sp.]